MYVLAVCQPGLSCWRPDTHSWCCRKPAEPAELPKEELERRARQRELRVLAPPGLSVQPPKLPLNVLQLLLLASLSVPVSGSQNPQPALSFLSYYLDCLWKPCLAALQPSAVILDTLTPARAATGRRMSVVYVSSVHLPGAGPEGARGGARRASASRRVVGWPTSSFYGAL